jgi:predicted dehydrogenase
MKKLRIGIIGCGGIGMQKHLPSLARIEDVEVVGFCDIIIERAEEAKKEFGSKDAKTYENYKDMLKDKSIDVIHVCTPNRSHSFITVDALEAEKHVMC